MTTRSIRRILAAEHVSDGAGVRLRRSIGTRKLDHLDPFLLLDEFKSDQASDYMAGFPDHPHRGFETVTYMLAGRMEHRDHAGNRGDLGPGSIQWMTAGRGIIHSEMPKQVDGLMWGFQLWVNLPSQLKLMPPRYQDIPAAEVPVAEPAPGVRIRVLSGRVGEVVGPVQGVVVDPLYFDVTLDPGIAHEFALPPGHTAFAYPFSGAVRFADGGEPLAAGQLVVFADDGDSVRAEAASEGGRFILLAAKPIGEPVARYGPFVMNTRAELEQAVNDYRSGRLG